jgi:PKD repeat protein
MKGGLLASIFVFAFAFLNAQISFQSADLPTVGWNHRVAQDTIISAQNWGSKGANQTYTFTNFQTMLYDTVMYKALTSTQQTRFTNGDIAITADNINFLIGNTTATDFRYEGLEGVLQGCATFVSFSPVPVVYQFPTAYNGTFANNSGFTKQITGSCVGQPLVNAIRITSSTVVTDTIDGWGKVTTPIGNYKCLRQKRTEFITTLLEYKLTAISAWATLSNTIDTNIRYYYLTKEAKGSVITFDYDSVDNPIKATWSTIPPADMNPTFTWTANTGVVSFTSSVDGYPDAYSWDFGDGSGTSNAVNPTHTYAANGKFLVCLTVTNGIVTNTKCDTVTITGLANVNFAPNAQTDTASFLQFGAKNINVIANDNDPNGDTLCVTNVWGSPASWLSIVNCSTLGYRPDSSYSGIDTFFYKVCDNQQPALCDTGMVIVNVGCRLPIVTKTRFSLGAWSYANAIKAKLTDSIVWTIKGNDIDTVYRFDTLKVGLASWYNSYSPKPNISINAYAQRIEVCSYVYNKCGVEVQCDTVDLYPESINEIASSNLLLSPNPAKNSLSISLTERIANAKLTVSDVLGRTILHTDFDTTEKLLDVSNWQKGVYFIAIQNKESRVVNRFLKE